MTSKAKRFYIDPSEKRNWDPEQISESELSTIWIDFPLPMDINFSIEVGPVALSMKVTYILENLAAVINCFFVRIQLISFSYYVSHS